MPASAGYLETDGLEKTWRVKQTDIAKEVDILSSRNQYDIVLPGNSEGKSYFKFVKFVIRLLCVIETSFFIYVFF